MYNPTRRLKRSIHTVSFTEPHLELPELCNTVFHFVPGPEDNPITSHVQHRRAAQPDPLRGAMLVALVVITVVLYLVLWELEQSSFTSVPKPNVTHMTPSPQSSGNLGTASTWYPPRIVQDKQISPLGKDDRVAVSLSKAGRTTFNTWPPPVTRVPEDHDTENLAEHADDHTRADEVRKPSPFDATYCNGVCRFLLPVRVGEQESKARMHITQLSTLARRLNRTMVLPHVGKSRMSACSEWPFGAYYDTNEVVHRNDNSGSRLVMDLQEFARWVDERPVPPNGFVVSMGSIHEDRRDLLGTQSGLEGIPFIVEMADVDPKILSCLESKFIRLHSSLPETTLSVSFDSDSLKTDSDASGLLIQLLSKNLDMSMEPDFDLMMEPRYEYTALHTNSSYVPLADIDVLALDYDLRHPLFASSKSDFVLHYSPALYDLADRLSENLGPFLGVHWRMENVPAQNLAWCAASLVSTLHALLQGDTMAENVRHVWLATDYPRHLGSFVDFARSPVDDWTLNGIGDSYNGSSLQNYGPSRKSSTFRGLSIEHDDAIGILAEAFQHGGDLEAWKLTDLAEQLRRYPYVEGRFEVDETLLDDSGVFGILDKLVVVQAKVFVSGSKDCSKTSSFSKQIIEARQESFRAERGKGATRNVVEYFGKG